MVLSKTTNNEINTIHKILLLIFSGILGYVIHMKIVVNLMGSFIFIQNELLSSLIYIFVLFLEIISIYIFISIIGRYRNEKKIIIKNGERNFILAVYFILLFIFLFLRGRIMPVQRYNLNPASLFELSGTNISTLVWIFNVSVFCPLGLLYPDIKFIYFLAVIIIIELLQALLYVGIFDINDIILYTTGFLIGKFCNKLIKS